MNFPDFKNKIISISIDDDSYSHDLINPYFEDQCGRIFIIGEIPKEATDSGWNTNKTGAVAWDSVIEYTVFDSYEDYQEATEISKNHKEETQNKENSE